MSQLTYSYISMILDLYTRDVANDLCQKTSLRSVVIIDGGHWVRFIKSKILISNWENIKVYVVNLDVFLIGNQYFAFNEPGSGNSNNHNGNWKLHLVTVPIYENLKSRLQKHWSCDMLCVLFQDVDIRRIVKAFATTCVQLLPKHLLSCDISLSQRLLRQVMHIFRVVTISYAYNNCPKSSKYNFCVATAKIIFLNIHNLKNIY